MRAFLKYGFCSVFFCSFVCDALAQDLSQKISYSNPGQSLETALKYLSKESGVRLEASRDLKPDVLVISVEDVSIGALMNKIAEACGASWEKTNNSYRLVWTRKQKQEQQEEALEYQKQALLTEINRLSESHAQTPVFDIDVARKYVGQYEQYHRREQAGDRLNSAIDRQNTTLQLPGSRLTTAVFKLLDIDQIANMKPGDYLVYSSNPNLQQLPISPGLPELLDKHTQEQKLLMEAAKNAKIGPYSLRSSSAYFGEPGEAQKLTVSIHRTLVGAYVMQIALVDSHGLVREYARGSFIFNHYFRALQDDKIGAVELPLPKTSIQYFNALRTAQSNYHAIHNPRSTASLRISRISNDLQTLLLNPEQYDPVSFIAGELLLKLAELQDKDVVACLPDELIDFPLALQAHRGQVRSTLLLKWLSETNIVEQDDDWIILRPADPLWMRSQRFDRAVLGSFLRETLNRGEIDIDRLASFAASGSQWTHTSVSYSYLLILLPEVYECMPFKAFPCRGLHFLQFYSALSPAQRATLKSTGQLKLVSLSPAMRTLIWYQLSQGFHSLWSYIGPGSDEAKKARRQVAAEMTEVFPHQLSQKGSMTFEFKSEPAVWPIPAVGERNTVKKPWTASELGTAWGRQATQTSRRNQSANFDRFKPGYKYSWSLKAIVGDSVYRCNINFDQPQLYWRDAIDIPFSDLPDEFKAEVEKSREKIINTPAKG